MKISMKLAVLVVFVSASMVFAAAKPAKDAKMTVKDANAPAAKTAAPAKDVNAAKPIAPPAAAPAAPKAPAMPVAPEAKPPKVEPNLPKPPAVPSAPENNEVAVTVNGSAITEGQLDARIMPRLARLGSKLTPAMAEQYKSRMRAQMLEGMILERLLDEQVKKMGITVTDSDVNDKITEILSQQGMTMDVFKSMLQAQGQDFEQVKHEIGKTVGYEKLIDGQLPSKDINDAEALAFYERSKEDYNTPEQVQASHILITPDHNNPDVNQAKAQAKAKAEKLLQQLKAGADFATLAKENSDCPSKAKGGDLGMFTRGQMVQPFEDVAFALKPGDLSDVVETQFGYHIIKVALHKPGEMAPFEKVKPQIVKMLLDQKRAMFFRTYKDKLMAEASIVYPPGKEPAPPTMEVMRPSGAPAAAPKPAPMPTPAPKPN
ncbi:MAG: peptidylprolyl isomerase [Sedimentisphaerales bacterium]